MIARSTDAELLRRKRDLQLEIGRSRRRIAGHVGATRETARQVLSWRTCVARHPLWSIAAALGLGMSISAGLRPGRVARRLGASLARVRSTR